MVARWPRKGLFVLLLAHESQLGGIHAQAGGSSYTQVHGRTFAATAHTCSNDLVTGCWLLIGLSPVGTIVRVRAGPVAPRVSSTAVSVRGLW